VILMDAGPIPPVGVSQKAHAGCLSFEMSSGPNRFIVNCGAADDPRWHSAARSTPAHSTLSLEDLSSGVFLDTPRLVRRLGPVMIDGPRNVPVAREDRDDVIALAASHDGYAGRFGAIHERRLVLRIDGGEIVGSDRLTFAGRKPRHDRFAIRFHLHPLIRANRTAGGDVLLVAPDGEAWTFTCGLIAPELEDSVFLSDTLGRRKSLQIVLPGRARVTPEVAWAMTRTAEGQRGRSRGRDARSGPDLFADA
jgi:uncharacterized heparinase superfamily protein